MAKGHARAREDRRNALLRAAAAVFTERGYHQATVAAITEAAGMATGSFYSYFSSKSSCFLGLVDDLYGRLMTSVLAARAGRVATRDKLVASVEAAVGTFLDSPDVARLVLGALHGGEPELEERVSAIAGDITGLLAADLMEIGGASLSPGEAEVRARFLMGGLERSLFEALSENRMNRPLVERTLAAVAREVVPGQEE